jgi:hypothetical protein
MSSKAEAKLQRDLAAQKKRVEALKYLSSHGCTTNEIKGLMSRGKTFEKTPVRQTDNTLECIRKQQMSEAQLKNEILRMQETHSSSRVSARPSTVIASDESTEHSGLPANWEAVKCEQNGLYYYWNKKTNETTWERPKTTASSSSTSSALSSATTVPLLKGWVQRMHPATNQVYYLHEASGGTRSKPPTDTDFFTDSYKQMITDQ